MARGPRRDLRAGIAAAACVRVRGACGSAPQSVHGVSRMVRRRAPLVSRRTWGVAECVTVSADPGDRRADPGDRRAEPNDWRAVSPETECATSLVAWQAPRVAWVGLVRFVRLPRRHVRPRRIGVARCSRRVGRLPSEVQRQSRGVLTIEGTRGAALAPRAQFLDPRCIEASGACRRVRSACAATRARNNSSSRELMSNAWANIEVGTDYLGRATRDVAHR